MTTQNRVHRDIDYLKEHYDADHDIGVEFNWVDGKLLSIIEDLQEQVEELAARLWKLEHPSPHYNNSNFNDDNYQGTMMQG